MSASSFQAPPGEPRVPVPRSPAPNPSSEGSLSGSKTNLGRCHTQPFSPQVIVFEEKMAGPMIQFSEAPHLGRSQYLN